MDTKGSPGGVAAAGAPARTLVLVVSPEPHGPTRPSKGRFEARLDGRLLCTSPTPLCSAARLLLAEGVDPATVLVMKNAGSDLVVLTAAIRAAARLTVDEARTPRFAKWKPPPQVRAAKTAGVGAPVCEKASGPLLDSPPHENAPGTNTTPTRT
jgi:hypothetical protein